MTCIALLYLFGYVKLLPCAPCVRSEACLYQHNYGWQMQGSANYSQLNAFPW